MLKFCWKYILKYKKELVLYLLISIVSTAIFVAIPIWGGRIIDLMVSGGDVKLLFKMGGIVLLLGLFNIMICYWNNKFYVIIQTNSAMDISADIIHHLHKIPLSEIQKFDIGYLNESINHDSNSITMFFLSLIVNAISNGLMLILSLLVVCKLSLKIGVILLLLISIYIIFFLCFRNKLLRKSELFKKARSTFFGALLEQFKNVKFVKQHALEEFYRIRLKQSYKIFFKEALATQQFFYLYQSTDNLLEVIVNFSIYMIGGISVIGRSMTVGGFTIILNFYRNIISAIKYFANLGKEFQENEVSYQRLENYINMPEQKNSEKFLEKVFTIECKNLSFVRDGSEILHNFNATFERGKIYCIQGENGSGKTTLMDLIIGLFLDEYTGNICFNDISIAKLDMKKMREQKISVLEQNPYMLEGSPADNIHLTTNYRNDKYFSRIVKKEIGMVGSQGDGISGGEKQKIGILRALAKDSDVLFFDEPTSALDQETRKEFYCLLQEIKKEKIIIFISHDKESGKIANEIIEL